MLSLTDALKMHRMEEFIAQEEARGIPAADRRELDRTLVFVIKPHQSEDQTSRLPCADGSNET